MKYDQWITALPPEAQAVMKFAIGIIQILDRASSAWHEIQDQREELKQQAESLRKQDYIIQRLSATVRQLQATLDKSGDSK